LNRQYVQDFVDDLSEKQRNAFLNIAIDEQLEWLEEVVVAKICGREPDEKFVKFIDPTEDSIHE